MVKKILFITLSNIGDVFLTLPSLDELRRNFPGAEITCIVGPRPKEIFQDNPFIDRLIVYEKKSGLRQRMQLLRRLRSEHFDMVVDLRNSLYGILLPARYKIRPFLRIPRQIKHMKDRHLYKVKDLLSRIKTQAPVDVRETSLFIRPDDQVYIKQILKDNKITPQDRVVVISVGARSHIKRWAREKFTQLVTALIKEFGVKVILVGDKDDQAIAQYVLDHCGFTVTDLSAKTNIAQLAYLFQNARLLITNDSASLHLASYVNIPVLGIFGPTNENKYGPWSDNPSVAKKEVSCRPCEEAQCRFKTLNCTGLVGVEDVLGMARQLLSGSGYAQEALVQVAPKTASTVKKPRRILIVRTDRIGDVLLSTPVIKAIRQEYPYAYIAMMVAPYAKEIVEGNPYLDEVIVYDKDARHKSWVRSMQFALALRKKKFDLALVLHPTNRVHLVVFFSGIKRRLGYDRKFGFLLSERIKHLKQEGAKHESEYALDLVRHLGIEPKDKVPYMPIKRESEAWVDELFKVNGIRDNDKILAIHPGASCPSKVWPAQRFAEVSDRLSRKYGFKVIVVAGPKDISLAEGLVSRMQQEAFNLAGMTSISQLASLLKRCRLFISNDSGPVHIASALGVPVVSIFGRSQRGLSPARWGPVGGGSRVAQSSVGCVECLAHNCLKGFACLKAVTADYVVNIAESLLVQS